MNRWVGPVSLGYGPDGKRIRRKILGKTPREPRHTFVSVMSASGVPVENIALLVGHDRTATTESIYRHEIRPALTLGAEVRDKIFA